MPDPMTTTSASFGIGERDEDDDEDADDGVAGDSDAEEADAQGVVCVRWRRTRGEMTVDAARGRGWQVIIGPHIALAVELIRVGSFIVVVVVVVVVCQVIAQVIAEDLLLLCGAQVAFGRSPLRVITRPKNLCR